MNEIQIFGRSELRKSAIYLHLIIHGEVNVVFNERFSSFALYEGKDGKDFLPCQVSSKFCPRDLDKKFIDGLRKLLVDFQPDEGIFKNEFIPHIYTVSSNS
jgi:hypothetical protein